MGSIRFGAPKELVVWLHDEFKVETFVETGTNRAETASWAAGVFDRVVSVEAFDPLYQSAKQNFGHLTNVDFRLGDSRKHLRELASSLNNRPSFGLMPTGAEK